MRKHFFKAKKVVLAGSVLFFLLTILVGFVFYGCEKRKNIEDEVRLLLSEPIDLCLDSMVCCVDSDARVSRRDSLSYYEDSISGLVVFLDSMYCSPCATKAMYQWYDIIDSTKIVSGGRSKTIFVFSSPPSMIEKIKYGLHEISFDSPVFIDTCGVFARKNPQISPNSQLHVFMIDKKHNVVMVGSPLVSAERRNTYFRHLKKMN